MDKNIIGGTGPAGRAPEADDLFEDVAEFVLKEGRASTSIIQHQFRLGYMRCGRLMDQLEHAGIIAPADGQSSRQLQMTLADWMEKKK